MYCSNFLMLKIQLNMFKTLIEIHEELENIDDQHTDKLWFENFSFKHKEHNWLREVEKQDKSGGRSSKCSSKSSSKSSSSRSSTKGHLLRS